MIRKEDYPEVEIDISLLRYKWSYQYGETHHGVMQMLLWERQLMNPSVKVHGLKNEAFVWKLYSSLQESGLIKPLIVKEVVGSDKHKLYYTLVGNHRLCCLKAMAWHGPVKCVVALPNDSWEIYTSATKLYENVKVEGFDE